MMRLILYGLILVFLCFAPVQRLDIAKLEPVEVVTVQNQNGTVYLATDTGAWGSGADAVAALQDMRQRTPGVIYLDTAAYLIVASSAVDSIDALRPWLKERICLCEGEGIDPVEAGELLEIHGQLPLLKSWKSGQKLPQIRDGKIIE